MHPAFVPQLLTPDNPRSIHFWMGGRAFRPRRAGLSIVDSTGVGVTSLVIPMDTDLPDSDRADLRIYDYSRDEEVFRGTVTSAKPVKDTKTADSIEITADSNASLIDDTYIFHEKRTSEGLRPRIGVLWGKYAGSHLSPDLSLLDDVSGTLEGIHIEGVTLRQAIEEALAEANSEAGYRVTPEGKLQTFTSQTEGAPFTISDVAAPLTLRGNRINIDRDGQYSTFPGVVRTANDRLLAVWRRATTHTSDDGVAVFRFSDDNGQTWGPETVYDDPTGGIDVRGPMLSITPAGTILHELTRVVTPGVDLDVYIRRSTNNGVTFGAPILLPSAGYDWTAGSNGQLTLANGDLITPLYHGIGASDWFVSCMRSSDDGLTWGSQVEIANGPADGRSYNEAALIETSPNNIVCLIRELSKDSLTSNLFRSVSTDNGASWSDPVAVGITRGRPSARRLADGRILMLTRSANPDPDWFDRGVWSVSADNGLTWSDEKALDAFDGGDKNEYGWFDTLANGDLVLVYSTEYGSTNADIFARIMSVTETIHPQELEIDEEAKEYANRVYVEGGTPRGSGYVPDDFGILRSNGQVRTRVISAPQAKNATQRDRAARRYFKQLAHRRVRGRFRTISPNDGWRAGQMLLVANVDMGIDAVVPITEVRRSMLVNTEPTNPNQAPVWSWTVRFGAERAGT